MKQVCFTILLSVYFLAAYPQQSSNYISKEFTTENGLPSNGIKGLQWDESTGFLWIATEAGIVRFDGINFKTFTRENTPFIASDRISFISRNYNGEINFADLPKNIITVQQNKLKSLYNGDLQTTAAFPIAVSRKFYEAKQRSQLPGFLSVASTTVLALSDTACFLEYDKHLYYFSISMPTSVKCIDRIEALFKLGNKACFTDQGGNIFEVKPAKSASAIIDVTPVPSEFSTVLKGATIKYDNGMPYPLVFKDGNVWLLRLDNNKPVTTLLMSGFPSDLFLRSAQYSEKLNIVFVGTDSKGLRVFYPKKVQSQKAVYFGNEKRNAYYSQLQLGNGNVLTNEGDIIGNSSLPVHLPIKGRFDYSVFTMNDTLLWYSQAEPGKGTYLHSYNYLTGKTSSYPKVFFTGAFFNIANKLYAVSDKGIGFIDDDSLKLVKRFSKRNDNLFFASQQLQPGIFAIASCDGLLKFDVKANTLDTILSKENYCVRSLWKYNDYLFIGTYGDGYYIYKNGQLKHMPLDKNKYLLYTHCFVPDDGGYIYMSTNRGLFKAKLQQVLEAFEHDNASVYYYYFGRNDGMEMTELNGGCTPCALILRDKTISFPTMDGLLWVNSANAIPALPEGNIYIDELTADDKYYNADSLSTTTLPAATSQVKIKLALSAWGNKENIYLDYQLDNSNKWISVDVDKGMYIELNNLSPGSHSITIRKLNGFGVNDYSYQTITFSIKTPWYKTWWFIVSMTILFFGVIYLWYKIRTRQYLIKQRRLEQQVAVKTKELLRQNAVLEKNNTIKTRLISIISHDLVTPLRFVSVAGRELLEKRKKMTDELQQETLEEITNTSQELQLLSTNILNWIKYQNENRRLKKEMFNLHEVVNDVLGVLRSLAKKKHITLTNDIPPQANLFQFCEPLKICIYNLVTNALNFTEEGSITISAFSSEKYITVNISDEGIGMSEEQIQNVMADEFIISSTNIDNKKGNGLGYLIIKDLLTMMNGTLEIKSVKHKGTVVSLIIPV